MKGGLCYLGTENIKQKAARLEKLTAVTWHPRVPETALRLLLSKTNKQTNLNTRIVEFPRKIIISSCGTWFIVRHERSDLYIYQLGEMRLSSFFRT